MDMMDWIFWSVPETIKYILVSYGVLGFSIRTGWKKYLVFLYLIIGIPVVNYFVGDALFYRTLWLLVFLWCFFEGKFSKKIQAFIL